MLVGKLVSFVKNRLNFEPTHLYDLYVYPELEADLVKERASKHLGAPYNASFYPDGSGFYCSQYIAEILPIFETIPMKFGDEEQEISDFGGNTTGNSNFQRL